MRCVSVLPVVLERLAGSPGAARLQRHGAAARLQLRAGAGRGPLLACRVATQFQDTSLPTEPPSSFTVPTTPHPAHSPAPPPRTQTPASWRHPGRPSPPPCPPPGSTPPAERTVQQKGRWQGGGRLQKLEARLASWAASTLPHLSSRACGGPSARSCAPPARRHMPTLPTPATPAACGGLRLRTPAHRISKAVLVDHQHAVAPGIRQFEGVGGTHVHAIHLRTCQRHGRAVGG